MLDEIPINVYYNEVLCGNDLHKALKIWLIGQVVKTSPSHGENMGSNPVGVNKDMPMWLNWQSS